MPFKNVGKLDVILVGYFLGSDDLRAKMYPRLVVKSERIFQFDLGPILNPYESGYIRASICCSESGEVKFYLEFSQLCSNLIGWIFE